MGTSTLFLFLLPLNNEVKNTKISGRIFIINKNNNFSSFKLNFVLNLEIIIKNIIKKGIRIPICLPKKING